MSLDRESGSAAISLRAGLKTLSASYSRLDTYRRITLAACPAVPTPVCPEALATFKIASSIEGGVQQWVRAHWNSQSTLWRSGQGIRSPFPVFNFPIATGGKEDLLRSWSQEFEMRTARAFEFWIDDGSLRTRARVWRQHEQWFLRWTE